MPSPIKIVEEAPILSNDYYHSTTNGDPLDFDIPFIKNMLNSESNTMTICDPNKYKYTKLLLQDIMKSNLNETVKMTSNGIERDYLKWKNECWTDGRKRPNNCWYWKKKVRIQIIDHKLYISSTEYEMERHIYDREGYRTGLFFYLCHLLRKYAKYLPNTDFIWYYHDYQKHSLDRFNWKLNGNIAYFFSDYNLAHLHKTSNLLLFSVSRAYLKYRYFAAIEFWKGTRLMNKYNHKRIADYLKWLELLNETDSAMLLKWDHKSINKAMFRGANNGRFRDVLYQTLINNTYIYNAITLQYFDVAMTYGYANTLSIVDQIAYRYMIVLDGITVRDSLMYQMKMGSVILKQLTTNYEWWYFDVVNGYHWILFENISHLMSIVINLVNTVEGYSKGALSKREYWYLLNHSMTSYSYDTLRDITQNSKQFIDEYLNEKSVDCWFIHMIQIYNKYLFDVNSINKSNDPFMRELPSNLYE